MTDTPPKDFPFYKEWLHARTGLALKEEKAYLLESRFRPVLARWGFAQLSDMTAALQKPAADKKLEQDVIDAMMTNETMFFRDDRPFGHFRAALLPELLKARSQRKKLRIWSAACSTGQEPYSIAMAISEQIKDLAAWSVEIVATDISDIALAQARSGLYSPFEVQRGLPPELADKYFKQEDRKWRIDGRIRSLVRFENFNLLGSMERLGTFDVIFCRNVLIYFAEEDKKKVLCNLLHRLAPDGALLIGGAETAMGVSERLKSNPACPGLYSVTEAARATQR